MFLPRVVFILFFFNDTATTEIYTLSLHDALPIFDVHDRLEQHGTRLPGGLLHGHRARDLERHLARVHVVVGAVHELHLHVDHRVPREHAALQGLLHALLHRADVLLGNRAAHDLVLEDEAGARLLRLEVDDDVSVLPAAARLANEFALHVLHPLAHRLAVGHLRPADVGVDLELPLHAIDDDLEVQLAHPADDRLRGLGVGVHAEGGVFFGELLEGDGQLVLVGLGLGLDGDRDHGLGEPHRLEDDRMVRVTQRVARLRVLEPDGRGDVARAHLFELLALVGVHLQQAPDALPAILGAVVHVRAGVQHARIDAEEGQLPDVGVGHDLEGERGEGPVVRGPAGRVRRVVVRQVALDRRDVDRRGQEIHHRVEQRLHALVLEGGAAQHGHDVSGDCRLTQHRADLVLGELVLLEVLVEDGVVVLDDRLEHLVTQLGDPRPQRGRDRSLDVLLPERLVVVHDLHLTHQVHDPGEQLARAEGELDRDRLRPEPLTDHLEALVEVGAHAVHLVDEDDARHAVAVRLAPYRFGLGLDAAYRVEQGHGAVEHPERALHLHREVHVPRGVDDVDAVLLGPARPEAGGGGGGNRDPPLLLLLHPVHRGRSLVHLAQLVGAARVVEDPLGRSRLPGIDVGHDADVPNVVERCRPWHCVPLSTGAAGCAPAAKTRVDQAPAVA